MPKEGEPFFSRGITTDQSNSRKVVKKVRFQIIRINMPEAAKTTGTGSGQTGKHRGIYKADAIEWTAHYQRRFKSLSKQTTRNQKENKEYEDLLDFKRKW
jgi:hypothetical protein